MERPELPRTGHGGLRTRCGRRIIVSRLVIGGHNPVGRVTVRINCEPGERGQLWAGLTVGEARLFACHLMLQAGLLECATGTGHRNQVGRWHRRVAPPAAKVTLAARASVSEQPRRGGPG